jgi:restriction system protein
MIGSGMGKRRSKQKSGGGVLVVLAFATLLAAPFWRYFVFAFVLVSVGLVCVRVKRFRRRRILDRHIRSTDGISGDEFEKMIVRLLKKHGFREVQRTGRACDLGADVEAIDQLGHRVVVQCKRYGTKAVGSGDMQKFLGTVFDIHEADIAIFITTSRFTKEAAALAERRCVHLVDRERLAAWMAADMSKASDRMRFELLEPVH